MTSPTPMLREELMELAALDAFGLLDDYESALYTRSFHHAPAAVQDEIIELQAELVSDPALLPDEEPSPELREKVLATVRRAISQEVEELAPIATIGRRATPDDPREELRERRITTHFWRAAALLLACSMVVLAFVAAETYQRANEITRLALNDDAKDELRALIGSSYSEFVENPNCRRIVLFPQDGSGSGAWVFVDEESNEAFVLTIGLPVDGEDFRLSLKHDDGSVEEVHRFTLSGSSTIAGVRVARLPLAALSTAVLQVTTASGNVLLASA